MIRADEKNRAWIVARMCGATVQDQVETPAAVGIRALGTDPRSPVRHTVTKWVIRSYHVRGS